MMINVRDKRQSGKLSEIQSDPTRVTTRVAGLGACLLFDRALGSIHIVLYHGATVTILLYSLRSLINWCSLEQERRQVCCGTMMCVCAKKSSVQIVAQIKRKFLKHFPASERPCRKRVVSSEFSLPIKCDARKGGQASCAQIQGRKLFLVD